MWQLVIGKVDNAQAQCKFMLTVIWLVYPDMCVIVGNGGKLNPFGDLIHPVSAK